MSWELDEVAGCSGSVVEELEGLGMVVDAWKGRRLQVAGLRKMEFFWVLAWEFCVADRWKG